MTSNWTELIYTTEGLFRLYFSSDKSWNIPYLVEKIGGNSKSTNQ